MNYIIWIVFGGIIGWVASIISRTNAQQGIIANVVIGILGAIVGGWLATFVRGTGVTGFNIESFVIALIGAIILIAVCKLFGIL